MWQVYLYLANERQVRERQEARTIHRARRRSLGRRRSGTPGTNTQRDTPNTRGSVHPH